MKKPVINDVTDLLVPAALRICLLFLLVLVLIGYPVEASILFAAVGGLAGGFVSAWWRSYGGAPQRRPGGKGDWPNIPWLARLPRWRLSSERRHKRRRSQSQ